MSTQIDQPTYNECRKIITRVFKEFSIDDEDGVMYCTDLFIKLIREQASIRARAKDWRHPRREHERAQGE